MLALLHPVVDSADITHMTWPEAVLVMVVTGLVFFLIRRGTHGDIKE